MPPPLGNQFWKQRSSHGPKPKFSDPEVLWAACVEYFEWVDNNPLKEEKIFCFQGQVTKDTISKMRAMSIGAICLFLDIHHSTWAVYRKNNGLSEVIANVEQIIYDQKFTGASADLLNPNIIARDLGLKDHTKSEHSGQIKIEEVKRTIVDPKHSDS